MRDFNEDVIDAVIREQCTRKLRAVDGDEAANAFMRRVSDSNLLDFIGCAAGAMAIVDGPKGGE